MLPFQHAININTTNEMLRVLFCAILETSVQASHTPRAQRPQGAGDHRTKSFSSEWPGPFTFRTSRPEGRSQPCSPGVILLVARDVVVGRAQSSLRRCLQVPIVDAVQEHFCQLNDRLPFFGWQVTEFVLYKVIHTLKRREGDLFMQLSNPERPPSQHQWWSLAKEQTVLYSQKPLFFH